MKKYILIVSIFLYFHQALTCQNWQQFGDFDGAGIANHNCLYSDNVNNLLYIGGTIVYVGATHFSGIVSYDGISFSALGNNASCLHWQSIGDLSAGVYCAINYNNNLYVGGEFKYADTNIVNNIARWDGTKWHPVGQGLSGTVRCLSVIEDTLYAGGNLYSVVGDTFEIRGIAKWDGINWCPVGQVNQIGPVTVEAIVEYKDEIYIGGNFGNFTDTLQEIARWNGEQWLSVGGGIWGDSWVDAMTVYKGDLYVGGYFYEQDGNAGNCIMRWDGETWSDVGGGLQGITPTGNAQVHALCIYNNELWVGGVHSYAGSIPAKRIAKWDGQKWCGIETNIDNRVKRFAVYNNMMYVAGGFDTIGTMHIPYIAKWTGGSYVDTCSTPINEIFEVETTSIEVYPNPATTTLYIKSVKEINSYHIYNITGQLIKSGKYNWGISITEFTPGIYFLKISIDNKMANAKFIKD